jgi:lysyl-tRNA synthetase class 2
MKRLLAAGVGDIYQFAPVFRDGERGGRHNPEFTLLEWYRVGLDYRALMKEVVALCRAAAAGLADWGNTRELTYAEAMAGVGVDPNHDDAARLAASLREGGVDVPEAVCRDREALLDLIMSTRIEPGFDPARPTIIYDFPPDQAALARIRPGRPPVAERFEVFLGGMELANGFGELTDPAEQRSRFEQDRARRMARGQRSVPLDEALLAAMEHGLPECSGVALGFDRLVMAVAGMSDISGALAFPAERA